MATTVLVSACIITYNHENYIRDCLDGALAQELNGEYEIVIGEDKSTDNTLAICEEYQAKFPEKINLIKREKNLGIQGNWLETMRACKGKYIAICEGDDYWTDPLKLQKQVDFMEANPDCWLCSHPAKVVYVDNSYPNFEPLTRGNERKFNLKEFIGQRKGSNFMSATMLFRSEIIKEIPSWFTAFPNGSDVMMKLLCGYKGYLANIGGYAMAVHRRVVPGSWSAQIHSKDWYINRINNRCRIFNNFNEFSKFKFDKEIKEANKRFKAEILFQVQRYCKRPEFVKLLLKNYDAIPYFNIKKLVRMGTRFLLGNKLKIKAS